VQQLQEGSFKAGTDTIFDVKSGGVGYGKVNAEGKKYASKVDEQLAKIESGELKDIPAEVP
jgi:basic membrane lipoprotein Med (substrate-binding protein (PBP1-ABC) superfamily)